MKQRFIETRRKSLPEHLMEIKKGEEVAFPIDSWRYVRVTATAVKQRTKGEYKFVTRSDADKGLLYVRRLPE